MEIRLPRLADRKQDLPLLIRHFLQQFAQQYNKVCQGLTPRAELALARYSWPGNIRELENVLGEACMMFEGDRIDVRDLPEYVRTPAAAEADETEIELERAAADLLPLGEMHRRYAQRVLAQVGGNKLRAARILGINRATLYRSGQVGAEPILLVGSGGAPSGCSRRHERKARAAAL